MIRQNLPFLVLFSFFYTKGQTKIIFNYDDSGNQVYRGTSGNVSVSNILRQNQQVDYISEDVEERQFWNKVKLYPIPVKDILTIQWEGAVNDLIDSVSLYQHNTIGWNFYKKNTPSLFNQVEVNMSQNLYGVYIVSFTLKDGRVYTKNIIKE